MESATKAVPAFQGALFFCSNFYPCTIEYEGITYPSSEHAFAASKSLSKKERLSVAKCKSPAEAKKLGRNLTLRSDWDKVRLRVMEEILRIKFSEPALRMLLNETKGKKLEELNYWNDTYWGMCRGKGQNHLGKILMKIRDE